MVRAEIGFEPYAVRLCSQHLRALENSGLPGGVHIVERYDDQPAPGTTS